MKEGLVASRVSEDAKLGVIIRLGCQTDFVRGTSFSRSSSWTC